MKKMGYFAILLLFTVVSCSVYSQQEEVIRDPRIDALVEKHIRINKKKKGIHGYRVQIFFGSKRTDMVDMKTAFHDKFPETDAYPLYHPPYYKVHIGNCRTKLEAEKLLRQVKDAFPNGFIVEDMIAVPDDME